MKEILAFGINFSRFQGILDLKYFNSMYKTHPDFETKFGGKKCVLYTGIYGTWKLNLNLRDDYQHNCTFNLSLSHIIHKRFFQQSLCKLVWPTVSTEATLNILYILPFVLPWFEYSPFSPLSYLDFSTLHSPVCLTLIWVLSILPFVLPWFEYSPFYPLSYLDLSTLHSPPFVLPWFE